MLIQISICLICIYDSITHSKHLFGTSISSELWTICRVVSNCSPFFFQLLVLNLWIVMTLQGCKRLIFIFSLPYSITHSNIWNYPLESCRDFLFSSRLRALNYTAVSSSSIFFLVSTSCSELVILDWKKSILLCALERGGTCRCSEPVR